LGLLHILGIKFIRPMNKYVKYGIIGVASLVVIGVVIKLTKKSNEDSPELNKEMEDLISRIDKAKK